MPTCTLEKYQNYIDMEVVINHFRSVKQNFLARLGAPEPPPAAAENDVGWFLLIMGYCLTSAIAIALEFWQLQISADSDNHHHKIPISLLLLSVALILAFAVTLAAKVIGNHGHARLLERVGILLVCMSFFIAITAPFPLYLKLISWFIFVASFLGFIIYVCCCFPPAVTMHLQP
ncbi:hypothetical protein C2S51_014870 [Perilla frutescens var. frutescens]|nr:hypothetical protein C2S51_014870 [Perilla frutescens var. frutescens]